MLTWEKDFPQIHAAIQSQASKKEKSMLALLIALAPMITNLTPAVVALIQQIKAQGGLTTDQIIANAGVTLVANDQKLIDDLKRLGVI
jgi:hypothetical protein